MLLSDFSFMVTLTLAWLQHDSDRARRVTFDILATLNTIQAQVTTCPAEMWRTLHLFWILSVPVRASTCEKQLQCLVCFCLGLTLSFQLAGCREPSL